MLILVSRNIVPGARYALVLSVLVRCNLYTIVLSIISDLQYHSHTMWNVFYFNTSYKGNILIFAVGFVQLLFFICKITFWFVKTAWSPALCKF